MVNMVNIKPSDGARNAGSQTIRQVLNKPIVQTHLNPYLEVKLKVNIPQMLVIIHLGIFGTATVSTACLN